MDICERHRRHRDYTRHDLREALLETAVCFPVYRSYVSASRGEVSGQDREYITRAVNEARSGRPDMDPELYRFLESLLLLRIGGTLEGELAMRFQQLTGPAMAKGVEDTAFYRFQRLVSLNEVGGDPSRFGTSPARFHKIAGAGQNRPYSLLSTTTHDTKRSEDVRARLVVLSEIPEKWADAVRRWSRHNDRYRRDGWPDRSTEYLFYQTLLGAWPIDTGRVVSYMEKAVREAKVHTSWTNGSEAYEDSVRGFVRRVMEDREFRADLESFGQPVVEAGRVNSLSQTLIKLTAPGIPDIYQGTELWQLSLVDPDNRRPVDFGLRQSLLGKMEGCSVGEILAGMEEGLPKLWLIRQALRLRHVFPEPFSPRGTYRPLSGRGKKAGHVLAFARGEDVVSVVPRLVIGLDNDWGDTTLELPAGSWKNVLSSESVAGGRVRLRDLLARFPVALLARKEGEDCPE